MKIVSKIQKFQEGGPVPVTGDPAMTNPAGQMPTDPAAPEAAPTDDPLVQLLQLAQEAIQSQNPDAAFAVCEGLLQLAQDMSGGGAAPEAAPAGEPVFKAGGKISRRV